MDTNPQPRCNAALITRTGKGWRCFGPADHRPGYHNYAREAELDRDPVWDEEAQPYLNEPPTLAYVVTVVLGALVLVALAWGFYR